MVSPGGGAALNPKTYNLTPNSNLFIFPPTPWEPDLGFQVKTHLIFFGFLFAKILILFSPSRFSHGWQP